MAAPLDSGHDRWPSCPHASELMRKKLEAAIPGIEFFSMEEAAPSQMGTCLAKDKTAATNLKLTVVSAAFDGMPILRRHRLVHVALQAELESGAIHSLPDLQTLAPEQWILKHAAARVAWVEPRLRSAIPCIEHLDILDVTNGHAVLGFKDGSKRALDPKGLELELTVVSSTFEGLKPVERQRLVSEALGAELMSGAVHALPRMKTFTPAQWQLRSNDLNAGSKASSEGSPKRHKTGFATECG
eukprot:TRINITY_DN18996_c0_g1_i1.p1 TRINITY_DN18996_c0_g1~~TRINITY_DN18996_c0_g1_i1.p1  ORF type:complete len:243 (-),score=39.97 TRINITY_DN18996_c0_g1_i1:115-843(-)